MTDPNSLEIASALDRFLRRGVIKQLYVAGGITPPPLLAYMVAFPRLWVILEGNDEIELEQDGIACVVKARKGEAIFIPGNCWNKPAWTRRVQVLSLLFGSRQIGVSLVRLERRGEPTTALKSHFHRPMEGPTPAILEALAALASTPERGPADCLLVEALLYSCVSLLRRPFGRLGGKADKTFQNISLYLQEHSQFPLTRESVAELFRLSPNHLSRLFRSEANTTFVEYLTVLRLERAKFLLRHHDRTIAEVANGCGFTNAGYFCKVFKQKLKGTPTDYRVQHATLMDQGKVAVVTSSI